MPRRLVALLLTLVLPQSASLTTFQNLNNSFHIDLPTGWRQLAPNEATRLGAMTGVPKPLTFAHPRRFYAVGPVDQWQRGDFTSPWLQVVEQDQEWYVGDEFATQLQEMWRAEGETTGVQHAVADITRLKVGLQQVDVVTAHRTSTPSDGAPATQSLDVHAPTGGQQVTLSFTCLPAQFGGLEPEFRRWLATLVFARVRRQDVTLADRLWGPLTTGAVVGLLLLVIYKHTRRRR